MFGSISAERKGGVVRDGSGLACSTFMKKKNKRSLVRLSAISFCTLGICAATSEKSNTTSMKCRHHRRYMRWLSCEVRELSTWTTAMLSEWQRTRQLSHCGPQIAASTMTGSSSFVAIGSDAVLGDH